MEHKYSKISAQQSSAWHCQEEMGWWLLSVPRLSLSPCTFGFVYLGEFSFIWEDSGAGLSTEAALALG